MASRPRRRAAVSALFALAAHLFAGGARAQDDAAAEFYRGKSIDFLIGAAAGGGYDLAGRAVAAHIGRHIPGNPQIVVRNMPAASSLVMTNHLYNAARRDGTVIGMPNNNIPLEPRLKLFSADGSNLKFDISRFVWIGTPLQEPQALFVWHTSPVRTVADLKTHKVVVGAVTVAADNYTMQLLLNRTYGSIMELVTGYPGQNDIFLAMERGEVQGNSSGISNLTVTRPQLLREGKVRLLVQYGTERHPLFKDVPTAIELMANDADRELWRVYSLKYAFARPIALPPEVPADRVKALREAFDLTMKDPLYIAEANKIGLDVNPLDGETVRRLVAEIQATPEPVITRLRALLTPPAKK
jgi:tripartite-type tricarboxylate transporter receptor subunit TctC